MESENQITSIIPDLEDIRSSKFSYIENEILRENLCRELQFVTFLLGLLTEYEEISGEIEYSIIKDLLIHLSSITEGILYWKVKQEYQNNSDKQKKKYKNLWVVQLVNYSSKKICIDQNNVEVFLAKKTKKEKRFENEITLNDLIEVGYKMKFYSLTSKENLHKLRNVRNNIHLGSLDRVEDHYTVELVQEMLKIIKDFMEEK